MAFCDLLQVAALRSLSTFAALSEEAAMQLRRVLIPLLGGAAQSIPARSTDEGLACAVDPASEFQTASATLHCQDKRAEQPSAGVDVTAMETESQDGQEVGPAELVVEALCAARQLLASFPGMQGDILPLIGNLICSQTGALPPHVLCDMLTFAMDSCPKALKAASITPPRCQLAPL